MRRLLSFIFVLCASAVGATNFTGQNIQSVLVTNDLTVTGAVTSTSAVITSIAGALPVTSTSVYVTGQSGALSVTIASAVAVTGAFFSGSTFTATNPGQVRIAQISGALTVTSTNTQIGGINGALNVTSTATTLSGITGALPVVSTSIYLTGQSGALSVTLASAAAVTGYFWNGATFTQTTPGYVILSGVTGAQPVVSTATTINGITGALPVVSTFTVAVPSISSIQAYNVPGGVLNTSSTATTLSGQTGALSIVSTSTVINFPTIQRAVVVSTGITTVDQKDTGRTIFIATGSVVGVVADTLVSLSPNRGLVGGTAATSLGVTAGKTLRLTGWCLTWRNGTAVAGGATAFLRGMATGATTATSPLIDTLNASTSLATVNSGATSCSPFPDGIDLTGNMTFGVSQSAVGAVAGSCITVRGFEW